MLQLTTKISQDEYINAAVARLCTDDPEGADEDEDGAGMSSTGRLLLA